MSNVDAGDLAIVKGENPKFNGKTCEVLYHAPASAFTLPDGYLHEAIRGDELRWVLRFPRLVECRCESGDVRMTHYVVGTDTRLRRIAGPGIDITETASEPTKETA
jgi:hypothetical protein